MTEWWQNWQNNHYHSNSNDNKNGIVTKTIFFPHELSSSPIFCYSNILFSMANTSYLLWLLYSIFCGSHITFSVTVTSHFLLLSHPIFCGFLLHSDSVGSAILTDHFLSPLHPFSLFQVSLLHSEERKMTLQPSATISKAMRWIQEVTTKASSQ